MGTAQTGQGKEREPPPGRAWAQNWWHDMGQNPVFPTNLWLVAAALSPPWAQGDTAPPAPCAPPPTWGLLHLLFTDTSQQKIK